MGARPLFEPCTVTVARGRRELARVVPGWEELARAALEAFGQGEDLRVALVRSGARLACGLDLDGRPIARRLSFTAGEGAYASKIAYDEAFAEFPPGAMLELDNVRQVDAEPGVEWMDSYTDDGNLAVTRLWPDRRTVQTLVAGVGAWGGIAAAALPWLRWIKHRAGKMGTDPIFLRAALSNGK